MIDGRIVFRNTRLRSTRFKGLLVSIALTAGAAMACAVAARADEPQTRAARLTFLQGTVSLDRNDNTASEPAQLNVPLLAGVRVATGRDGQAEIEFEDGSVVRLTPNSALALDNLSVDDNGDFATGLTLLHGLAYAELRATERYRYSLATGNDLLTPVENSTVRINFDEPPAVFSVIDGTVHVTRGENYSLDVAAGYSLTAGRTDPANYQLTQQIAEESWDQWNIARDQVAADESAARTSARNDYAGAQGYGWSDLDANGSWYQVPGQGAVWQPSVAGYDDSFDPYANGAWVYYSNTGYIWASAYSWGWTPYRCGNWSYYNNFGWGWVPAGCGGRGWGLGSGGRGGGGYVNILLPPRGYEPVRVPRPKPGPIHPILPVRLLAGNRADYPVGRPSGGQSALREIDGHPAYRILPTASAYTTRSNVRPTSSLQRDFPIDPATRTPVVGRPSTQPASAYSAPNRRPDATRQPADQTYRNQTYRNQPSSSTPYVDPAPQPGSQTYGNQASPRPSPPASVRENRENRDQSTPYVRPAQPASQPAPHPTYTPPAAQQSAPAPQSRPSPPPPAPAPAPASKPAPAQPSPK